MHNNNNNNYTQPGRRHTNTHTSYEGSEDSPPHTPKLPPALLGAPIATAVSTPPFGVHGGRQAALSLGGAPRDPCTAGSLGQGGNGF